MRPGKKKRAGVGGWLALRTVKTRSQKMKLKAGREGKDGREGGRRGKREQNSVREGWGDWRRESYVCQEHCTSRCDWCSPRIFFFLTLPTSSLFIYSSFFFFSCIVQAQLVCFFPFFFSPQPSLPLLSLFLSISRFLAQSFCDSQQKADGVRVTCG